jgi:hypothetical protein
MRAFGKCLALLFTLMVATSSMALFTAKPTDAQSVPTPSVPEFYLHVVDAPYLVASTNYSTGQTETRQVSNKYLEVIVKNQPFNYTNNSYNVYYNVRFKPNFQTDGLWMKNDLLNITSSPADEEGIQSYAMYLPNGATRQSSGQNTTIKFALAQDVDGYNLGYYYNGVELIGQCFPSDGKIDFEVEALVGHASLMWTTCINDFDNGTSGKQGLFPVTAYDSSSGWSSTQTLDLAYYTVADPSPTTSAATSTTLQDWFWLIIAFVIVAVLLVAAAVKARTVNTGR